MDQIPRSEISYSFVHRTHKMIGMATMARLPAGGWASAWHQSEEDEGIDGQKIMVSFSSPSESLTFQWEEPYSPFENMETANEMETETGTETGKQRKGADWGPVLHYCHDQGKLFMFFSRSKLCFYRLQKKQNNAGRDTSGRRNLRNLLTVENEISGKSSDILWARGGSIMVSEWSENEKTWSEPREIYTQNVGEAPKMTGNSVFVPKKGVWMLPFWQEIPAGNSSCLEYISPDIAPASSVLISKDGGVSWKVETGGWVGESDRHMNVVEPSVVRSKERGKLLMLVGTNAGHIHVTSSKNMGATWDSLVAVDLLDPGLQGTKPHALRLADNLLAIAYNNMHFRTQQLPEYEGAYSNLFVAMSSDDGNTWMKVARLEDQIERGLQSRSPTMVQYGCQLYVVYTKTYGRNFVKDAEGRGTVLGIKLAKINLRLLN